MAFFHKKKIIHYGAVLKEESIHYGAMSQKGEHSVWRCVTGRRVSSMALCHKKERIHFGAVL